MTTPQPATAPLARPHDRLSGLRREMAARRIDGFFIPRADEFQGEYVPDSNARLAWISGFQGSAGCAIVLTGTAGFFTDGRYTLQTLSEVDGDHFERYSTAEDQAPLKTMTPHDWLARELKSGQVFGIDPWLHTPADVAKLREAVERAGAQLKMLDDNPLDAAWGAERPAAPLAPAVPHPLKFSGVASSDKRRELAAKITTAGADALIVAMPEDACWLLNVRGGDVACTPFALSYVIAHVDSSADWFVDGRKVADETRGWTGADVRLHPLEDFASAVEALASEGKKIWLDPAATPARIDHLARAHGQEPITLRNPIAFMKACKNATEIAGAEAAHLRDGVAITRFLAAMSQQSTPARHDEISAADFLYDLRKGGEYFKDLSFDTISGAGGNGAIVHYRASPATSKPLLAGPIYLVDSGGQYLDGTTDITRTIAVDTVTEEMRDHYTRVLKGHIQVSIARFPAGTTGDVLDAKARAPLREVGLDYAHGTGHGVGSYLSVHEGPCSLSPRGTTAALMPGMIMSNEPGYYKQGAYGIRIENLILVIDTGETGAQGRAILGFRTLTLAPYDRALIEPALLTVEERAWVDNYHAEVRRKLLPLVKDLDTEAAAYLIAATEPL